MKAPITRIRFFVKNTILFVFIALSQVVIVSCQSLEEKRLESIKLYLEGETNPNDIKIISLEDKTPLNKIIQDSLITARFVNLLQNIDDTRKAIDSFKESTADSSKRVWIKTMTKEQKDAYQMFMKFRSKALGSYQNISSYNWDSQVNTTGTNNISIPSNYIITDYKNNRGEKIIEVFYFNGTKNQSDISVSYKFTQGWIECASNIYINRNTHYTSPIPSLENEGFDIVPEDEDPTKTKEERAEIKAQEITEKEKRKNEKLDTQIKNDIRAYINAMNANGSVQVDDITIFQKAAYNSSTISIYYRLNVKKSDYSSYQWEAMGDFKKTDIREQCKDVLKYFIGNVSVSRYEVEKAFERIGLKWKYIYKDIYGNTLFTIEITADELS